MNFSLGGDAIYDIRLGIGSPGGGGGGTGGQDWGNINDLLKEQIKNFEKIKQGNNKHFREQFNSVVNKLKLNKDQRQILHREISGKNYNYRTILKIAKELFNK